MHNSIAIVSGSDARYFGILMDLMNSLRENASGVVFDFCLYDIGLTPEKRRQVEPHCHAIFDLDWCMDFPERDKVPGHHRLRVCRPFMPKNFPGHDIYIWLDADFWVQDATVLDIFARAAGRGKIAIAAEYDRAYKQAYKRGKLFGWTHNHKLYRLGFGWRVADRYGKMPILNSGAFSLRAESPFWEAWAISLQKALNRSRHPLMEQTSMNLEIYRDFGNATVLLAYCNWLCGAAPLWVGEESGMLVEPFEPHHPIGLVHLAGEFDTVESLKTIKGNVIRSRLDFTSWKKTCLSENG